MTPKQISDGLKGDDDTKALAAFNARMRTRGYGPLMNPADYDKMLNEWSRMRSERFILELFESGEIEMTMKDGEPAWVNIGNVKPANGGPTRG